MFAGAPSSRRGHYDGAACREDGRNRLVFVARPNRGRKEARDECRFHAYVQPARARGGHEPNAVASNAALSSAAVSNAPSGREASLGT